jgi:hypothetical protein
MKKEIEKILEELQRRTQSLMLNTPYELAEEHKIIAKATSQILALLESVVPLEKSDYYCEVKDMKPFPEVNYAKEWDKQKIEGWNLCREEMLRRMGK